MRFAAACFAGVLAAACSGSVDRTPHQAAVPGPVLVIGLDGLEWNVLYPLLAEGRVPHLAGLLERGTFGLLRTFDPNYSPRLWTSAATGKPPEKHGIAGFTSGSGDERRLFTSDDRRVKAFWNILTDYGVSCDVIGWWNTFPVEPIQGWMVAQANTLERDKIIRKGAVIQDLPGQVWPVSKEELVFSILEQKDDDLETILKEIFGSAPDQDPNRRWTESTWAFRADATYAAIAAARRESGPPAQLTALYFGGTDVVGHRFWYAYEPKPFGLDEDDPDVLKNRNVIPAYYEYIDRIVGDIVASFPDDTTIMILADHGMGANPNPREWEINSGNHHGGKPGFFLACGPTIRASGIAGPDIRFHHVRILGTLMDVCPTLLTFVGIPTGEDMTGRPIAALFESPPPLRTVPTHDDEQWLEQRVGRSTRHTSTERLDQLENLGYIGSDED